MRKRYSPKKIPYHIFWASKGEYGRIRLERFKKRFSKRMRKRIYSCPKCGNNIKSDWPHVCPFKADMNGDYDTLCRCCDSCRHECAMDV